MERTSIEPSLAQKPTFSITWESTMKCNLDCSYCSSHDNSIPHPDLEDCLKTVDFFFEYAELYLSVKNQEHSHVSFNIFGGESLFHPNIVEILEYSYKRHKDLNYTWSLGLNTVTNALVKQKVWEKLVGYIDFFTVSYHSESSAEDQKLIRENILFLKKQNKNFHCAVLMHPKNWDNCVAMVEWCKENNIPHVARNLDHHPSDTRFLYDTEQVNWFNKIRGISKPIQIVKKDEKINTGATGRGCCGGQTMSINQDYSCTTSFISDNSFVDWSCGVNYFFVYARQTTKEVFINKDCKMNYDGEVGPIGTLDDTDLILSDLRERLKQPTVAITCKKSACWCGLCTPKANTKTTFDTIMKKYLKEVV